MKYINLVYGGSLSNYEVTYVTDNPHFHIVYEDGLPCTVAIDINTLDTNDRMYCPVATDGRMYCPVRVIAIINTEPDIYYQRVF